MLLKRSQRLRVEGYTHERVTEKEGHAAMNEDTEEILEGYPLKDTRVTEESLEGYALKNTPVNRLQRKVSKVTR